LLLPGIALGSLLYAQAPVAPLSLGKWYKFSVTRDGVFKIDYNLLKKAGINPDEINPKTLQLFGAGTGMLPQKNSAPRNSLSELAISVQGEEDDKFNNGDFILFFGQGPDNYRFDVTKDIFWYENNLFSEKNFYFLTVGTATGKRLADESNIVSATGFPVINEYDDLGYYETDQYNELKSGRDWFGEQFDAKTEIIVRFDLPGIVENSSIKMVSNVMAQSFNGSSFNVFFNDVPVVEQAVDIISNTTYGIKGKEAIDTISFSAASVSAPSRSNQDIKYQYSKAASGKSIGYLDYFLFSFKRKLAIYGNQTIFSGSKSVVNPVSTFEIASGPTKIWDVTDPWNSKNQLFNSSAANASFSVATNSLKRFVAFKEVDLAPFFESEVPNQNLSEMSSPDLLIVTHPDLKSEALRLSTHRQNHSKISTQVVTTAEIYNHYSGGRQDITAIRDFAKDLYNRSGNGLNNLLLFGRCSYDYKNRVLANTNLVPTYESKNSLSPLETYSSDDYFAFFEPNEGEWNESPTQNHSMDIGIGRLSVKNKTEAKDVVDKLIDYDINQNSFAPWRKNVLFVADDGDFNIHQGQADQLAAKIDLDHPELNIKKIYLDSYAQIEKPSGQISPDANESLNNAVKSGASIVNFTGHGSEQVWMQERVLDDVMIKGWKNAPQYPLFVTATCEFGRHDDPGQISSGEKVLLQKKGGGIGLVTTARPVNSSTNFTLNKAFYDALFTKSNGNYRDLGAVFRDTKNNSVSGVANRNFSLLGDPSMKLTLSDNEVKITEMKTLSNSDTLKALSRVSVKGEILQKGIRWTDFSGELEATLFDKEEAFMTRGDENPIFTYKLWDNALFRGKASIINGSFAFEFVMPKNIDQQTGLGKMILYANTRDLKDAQGSLTNFKIGKSETNPAPDSKAPGIELFMGDTTYLSGGLVGPNTTLVVRLEDENGINISKRDKNHNLTALLDDSITFVLNEYYVSDKNDYSHGLAQFPLTDLKKGKHSVTVGASDTYNNRSTGKIDFVVTDGNQIVIDNFVNYPNPFSDYTTLEFVHSRVGEDLDAVLTIYDMTGQLMDIREFNIPVSQYRVTLDTWDGKDTRGNKLGTGVYLAKLSVRSLLDGSKNDQFTKLIILN
jgi:Peptidase family C25